MGFVAVQRLRWGDGHIEPGDPVPEGEVGRAYDSMVRLGQIAEVALVGDDQLRQQLAQVTQERDDARAKAAAVSQPVVPDGVVPGDTPGWPLVAIPAPLSDEQRAVLAAAGISGTHTEQELVDWLAEASSDAGPVPEGVIELGGGWFQLADGSKVRGRDALTAALAAPPQ